MDTIHLFKSFIFFLHSRLTAISHSTRPTHLTSNGRMSGRPNTDPLDLDAEVLFNKLDILLAVDGQLLKRRALGDIRLPAWEGRVLDLDLGQQVQIGGEVIEVLAIERVLCADLDFLEPVENIELGQVERGVPVDHGRILHDDQVEPSASTTTAGRDSPFGTDFLQLSTDVVELFGRERSTAHTGGVGLDDTNDALDDGRRDTETGANASDGGGG